MNKNRKLINALLVSTMMLSGLALDVSAADGDSVKRLGGDNRIDTSIVVSNEAYANGSKTVVLAGWDGEVDALTGTLLASAKEAPLLIVSPGNLGKVKAQIAELNATDVILLGGKTVINESIENDLNKTYTVSRIGGDNRYETAAAVATEVAKLTDGEKDHVFITNDGWSGALADALTAGPVSGDKQMPILITGKDSLNKDSLAAIKSLKATKATIVGGKTVVSDKVKAELEAAGITVDRVGGDNRYETAVNVAKTYYGESKKAIIANNGYANGFADALVGGYFGAKEKAPVLFTSPASLSAQTANYLDEKAMFAYVLGGEAAVSNATMGEVETVIKNNKVEEKLAVESVSAINATEVKVTFSAAVDKADAAGSTIDSITTSNLVKYSIGGVNPTEVDLSDDGKTATLGFAATIEGENVAVVVEPITSKADDNVKTERYAGVLTYEDKVKPTVASVESVSGGAVATDVEIVFSEKVTLANATVKLNGKEIVSPTLEADEKTLKLSGLDLDTSKNHTLEIVNLEDLATKANITSYINKTFKVTIDTTAPTLTSVVVKNDNKLLFTFSKPVVKPNKSTAIKILSKDLSDITNDVFGAGDFTVVTDSNDTQYEVTIDNAAALLLANNPETLTIQFVDKKVVDKQGNKLAEVTKTVTLKEDKVEPKLTKANYRTDSKGKVKELTFTFDEDVTLTTQTALTDLLSDTSVNIANGVAGDLKAALGGSLPAGTFTVKDNVITFAITTPVSLSGEYKLEVAANKVKDTSLATNANKAHSFTLDFGAAKAEETFKVTSASSAQAAGVTTITVKFDEPVKGGTGSNSATLLSSYKLNGKALPAETTITLNTTQDEAKIVLPVGSIKETDDVAIFVADNIITKDGKKSLETFTETLKVVDNIAPELVSVVLTADNNLLVTFSEKLTTIADADFALEINDKAVVAADVTGDLLQPATGSDAGKYIIMLSELVQFDNSSSGNTELILTSGNITIATGSDVTGSFKYATSTAITSIKLSTVASPITTEDGDSNIIKGDKEIVIK